MPRRVSILDIGIALVGLHACAPQQAMLNPMWRHYGGVDDVQNALIQGDLDRARRAGQRLAEHDGLVDSPASAGPYVTAMRGEAARVAAASTLAGAARATGNMVRICGACHEASRGGQPFRVGGGPEHDAESVTNEMRRHEWAVNRMMEGLIGPSNDSWLAGATTLSDAQLFPLGLTGREEIGSVRELETRLRRLGERASTEEDVTGRGEIYSDLLTTCASCHTQMRS